MSEDSGPVALETVGELNAARAAKQQRPQRLLAPLDRERPPIDAVELEQVERCGGTPGAVQALAGTPRG